MSAASVSSQALTTAYIQSPARFLRPGAETRQQLGTASRDGPAPASYYRKQSASSHGVTLVDGMVPRVVDAQPHAIRIDRQSNPHSRDFHLAQTQQQSHADASAGGREYAPPNSVQRVPQRLKALPGGNRRGPRANPNSRTSAGFPLAVTEQMVIARAAAKKEQEQAWERQQMELFEQATAEAIEKQQQDADEQAERDRVFFQTAAPARRAQTAPKLDGHARAALARQAQLDLAAMQMRNSKKAPLDREVPPKPTWAEDPLTARATEHTGLYPELMRLPNELAVRPDVQVDDEPCAPEGSAHRDEQRRRTNPLLDATRSKMFAGGKNDAASLGYGRTHRNHFTYLSHWSTPGDAIKVSAQLAAHNPNLSGYRSKRGPEVGYREEARALGWGHEHPSVNDAYNSYVSVRGAADVLADYPNRQACERFFNSRNPIAQF